VKRTRRVLLWAGGLLGAFLVGIGIWIGPSIYRSVVGVDAYETTPPKLPADLPSPAILVFSKTNGFRHDEAIVAANAMFRDLARDRTWSVYATESGGVFNAAQLARFDAVVWNNASGDVLTPAQQAAFKDYLLAGGGFVGIHGSGGDPSYRWRWYVDELIGAQFIGHIMWPQFQRATIQVEDLDHPAMAGLPRLWERTDEWYSFDRSVRPAGYRVLATLDESSYEPLGLLRGDLSMGGDHPIVWSHCVGNGRALFSALGHTGESYSEPQHREMLANAVQWAVGKTACNDGQ